MSFRLQSYHTRVYCAQPCRSDYSSIQCEAVGDKTTIFSNFYPGPGPRGPLATPFPPPALPSLMALASSDCNAWPPLSAEEIGERMPSVPMWNLQGESPPHLVRDFTCKDFAAALEFVNGEPVCVFAHTIELDKM